MKNNNSLDKNAEWQRIKKDIHSPFLVMLHSTLINGSIHQTSGKMAQEIIKVIEEYAFPTIFTQELQKAREEERERIEAIFKENVPPHAMDLEDSVWLKRLLNKAFNHDKNI